jgi:hypothetical protein
MIIWLLISFTFIFLLLIFYMFDDAIEIEND